MNRSLDTSLTQMFRAHRLSGESPTVEDAEDEAAELERQLRGIGKTLGNPPPPDLADFGRQLERRQRALGQLEAKLHKLSDDPAFPRLLNRFERLLKGQGRMLGIFEVLVKLLPQPQPELVHSFEDLLEGYEGLIASFARLIDGIPAPSQRLLLSFADLLETLEGLLHSFEDLLNAFPNPLDARIDSFEALLHTLTLLLGDFEDLLKLRRPPSARLLGRFEDLLKGLEDLLLSFGHLVEQSPNPPDSMVVSFARLIDELEALLKSFAKLLRRAPPSEPLVESFEALLHGLYHILDLLRPLVFGTPEHIGYFELLLHQFDDLLARFEALAKRVQPLSLGIVESFEALLKELLELLLAFEDMVTGPMTPHQNDPDYWQKLVESFDWLVDEYEELVDSLQTLKDRLLEIPESLLLSDIEVLNGLQKLLLSKIGMLSTASFSVTDEAEAFLDTMATATNLGRRFATLCSRRGLVSETVKTAFTAIVTEQEDLLRAVRQLVSQTAVFSAGLNTALADLQELHDRLVEDAEHL